MAGAQYSCLLTEKKTYYYLSWLENILSTNNLFALLGLETRNRNFTIGGRELVGITEITQENVHGGAPWRFVNTQLYIGYRFALTKKQKLALDYN